MTRERTCENCGKESRPAWTSHRGRQSDLFFCSDKCRSEWSFEQALDRMKIQVDLGIIPKND